MFGADSFETILTSLSEDKSWDLRVICQEICFEDGDYLLFSSLPIYGVVYSLTKGGHIEVISCFNHLVYGTT